VRLVEVIEGAAAAGFLSYAAFLLAALTSRFFTGLALGLSSATGFVSSVGWDFERVSRGFIGSGARLGFEVDFFFGEDLVEVTACSCFAGDDSSFLGAVTGSMSLVSAATLA
jgi:hypothetical protein